MNDLEDVKALIALAASEGLAELEVSETTSAGRRRIRIVRPIAAEAAPAAPATTPSPAATEAAPGGTIAAPLTGTFYQAPAPGEPPFVQVGDEVTVGETLCIIESMKMMNKVAADRAGVVAAALVENGQPVRTGTPLFRIV